MKGSVCSCRHCKHDPRIKDYTVFWPVCAYVCVCVCEREGVWLHQCALFVCARVCLSFYRPRVLGPFFLIVLRVPHWGGRRGRLTMFPVGEALMLSPGGNAVQSHFPFICCVSFNATNNHRQSHRALRAGFSPACAF